MLLVRQFKFHPSQEANRKESCHPKNPLGMKERLKVKAAWVTGKEGSLSMSDKMVCWVLTVVTEDVLYGWPGGEKKKCSSIANDFRFVCAANQKLKESQELGGNSGRAGPLWRCNQLHQHQERLERTARDNFSLFTTVIVVATSCMWLLNTWDVASIPEELISPLPSDFILNRYVAGHCYKFWILET